MNESMKRFFDELDAALVAFANGQRLELYHIGRSALVLQFGATLATKDIDIIVGQQTPLEEKALELFGKNTPGAKEMDFYLDFVPEGLTSFANSFRTRAREFEGGWQVIRLMQLEPNDLAATKMKSFRLHDRQDLKLLCDLGVLEPDKLRRSIEASLTWETEDVREKVNAHLDLVINYLEGRSRAL